MSDNPYGEVPALPAALVFGVLVLAVQLVLLLRSGRPTWPRLTVAAAVAVYAAGILANTVFPMFLDPLPTSESWTPALALVPFHDYEVADALENVAVFVPLGVLIPLLVRRPSWWRVLLVGAGVSLTIELLQLAAQRFFSGGHVADVNDFTWNTVGGITGYALFALVSRVPGSSRVVDRFRRHPTEQAAEPAVSPATPTPPRGRPTAAPPR